jgi:hypothetical protein
LISRLLVLSIGRELLIISGGGERAVKVSAIGFDYRYQIKVQYKNCSSRLQI